jgi:NAD(P)H-hydrate epimerase
MARLVGGLAKDVQADREGVATGFARTHGCVVVLKGAGTLVAAPDGRCWRNPTGNPGMATGGTGDVLTGLTAGVLAQLDGGDAAVNAACIAVYVHGLAGDLAARRIGERGLIARDLAGAIPEAWRHLEETEHAHADRG